ncbi:hypothetical protein [Sphingopyxis sp. KK2]|uniref:hypothetical protein n=1 Tax=Sphingopyxis sp. KK2 TaxID=1855727 RepID=UPI00097E639D|nr:hypothetical protein [Sphingopyxis sp. KK2]
MRILLPLAALALFAAAPAAACSPAPGARVPTNMELVERADLILVGTVTGGTSDPDAGNWTIAVAPVTAIKGELPPGPLTLDAMVAPDAESALLSNPYDLAAAHPQAEAGACNRYAFPLGTRVLFFLQSQGDGWAPAEGLFSRWAEDVLTDDAPWLTATKFYVEVAALPEGERGTALTARRDELRKDTANPVAQLLADDIDRQLAGPNPPLRDELPPLPDDGDGEPAALDTPEEIEGAAEAAAAAARCAAAAETDRQMARCQKRGD